MTKKWIAVLLSIMLLLAGCGQAGEPAPAEDSPPDAAEEEERSPPDAAEEEERSPPDAAEEEKTPPAAAEEEGEAMGKLSHPQEKQTEEEEHALTVSEAVNFLMSLSPRTLGLPGDTMGEYQAYPATEVVAVDGLACSKLLVYEKDEVSDTNAIRGIYLLTRGGERRLYRLDQENGAVVELALPVLAGG